MRSTITVASVAACVVLLPALASAQAPAPEAARAAQYLAANCANCHGTTGQAKGAMPIRRYVPTRQNSCAPPTTSPRMTPGTR